MRKLFWQISSTLDGFMEGPNHELTDTAEFSDPDFDRYASQMLQEIDAIVLGRVTYQVFVKYWPTATGPDADRLNTLPKIVFSKTLQQVEWNNSRLGAHDPATEIRALKHQPGGDIAVFGSADLAASLLDLGLIDEVRLLVTPVIAGQGKRTFKDGLPHAALKLAKATAWSSGTMALHYKPA